MEPIAMTTLRRPPQWVESEDQFLSKVIRWAKLNGWMVHHSRPARDPEGKVRTHLQGDKGLPDLILARDGEVLFAELKSNRGTFKPEQRTWLQHLGDFGVVWRPRDWDEVQRRLARRVGERGA
jgi:hypothetical protein